MTVVKIVLMKMFNYRQYFGHQKDRSDTIFNLRYQLMYLIVSAISLDVCSCIVNTQLERQSQAAVLENSHWIIFDRLTPAFCAQTVFLHTVVIAFDIQGGPKKRGHSTFSQISRKVLKISKWFFAHIKASVCRTWHIHTNFSNSFYSVAPSGEYW